MKRMTMTSRCSVLSFVSAASRMLRSTASIASASTFWRDAGCVRTLSTGGARPAYDHVGVALLHLTKERGNPFTDVIAWTLGVPSEGRKTPERAISGPVRGAVRLEEPLHEQDIDPATIQEPLLAVDADLAKTEPPIERDARGIRGETREHQLVEAELAAELDETLEQHRAGAPPA